MRARRAFLKKQDKLAPERLVFVDESGCHPGIGPRRGWSPKGEALVGPEQAYARGQHVSMLAALRLDGICAKMTVRGGVKGSDFHSFVTRHLLPALRKDDIVVWDNLSLHRNRELRSKIEASGGSVVFLPKYSPDLNPIEAAWAKVKAWIRKLGPKEVPALRDAMRRGLRRIRPADACGWFKYCGYAHQDP